MCLNTTTLDKKLHGNNFLENAFSKLQSLESDGLIVLNEDVITVTEKGKLFIRNICAAVDAYLLDKEITTQTFSKAI